MNPRIYIILVFVCFGMRFLLNKFMDATDTKLRLVLGIGLFGAYTVIMQLYLLFVYDLMMPADIGGQESHPYVAGALVVFQITFLVIGIIYYCMQKKHKISDRDKMKLKDL